MNNNDKIEEKQRTVIQLSLRDEADLHGSYMPFIKDGGIFVPTQNDNYRFGDEVIVSMVIQSKNKKVAIPGKVAWIAPPTGENGIPGIGVKITGQNKNKIKHMILDLLGNRAALPALNRFY